MSFNDTFWRAKRREFFPSCESINLNAGTLSPTPLPILDAVSRLRARQAAEPSDFLWRQCGPLLDRARAQLGAYLNAAPAELLLLPNVTHAVGLAVASLDLPAGSEILTTDHEYGAMMYCWERRARERGWTIRQATLPYNSEDPAAIVSAIDSAATQATRALFFSHVACTTGLVNPAADLCALARMRGWISVIDGAHAAGMVPIDTATTGADFYAGNCHKWMMAPLGAGFLSIRRELKGSLQPLVTSWGWKHPPEEREIDSGEAGTKWQFALEFHGCTERCPQLVLPEVLALRESLGGEGAISARTRELAQYARARISSLGFAPATPENPDLSGAIIAFEFPAIDTRKWRDWIWNTHRVECPITQAALGSSSAGRKFLRVSTPWYVTFEELDKLAAILSDGLPL